MKVLKGHIKFAQHDHNVRKRHIVIGNQGRWGEYHHRKLFHINKDINTGTTICSVLVVYRLEEWGKFGGLEGVFFS